MSLILTGKDSSKVQATLDVLLSCVRSPDFDEWRRDVNRAVRDLVGADKVAFLFPVAGRSALLSEEIPADVLGQAPARLASLDSRWSVWTKAAALGVHNRALVFGPQLREFYRSEYYHEFVLPARLHDALGITVSLEGEPSFHSAAGLYLFHDSVDGARFGNRALLLLRLLRPAFAAAVQLQRRQSSSREDLSRTVDGLDEGILFCATSGEVLHRTPMLRQMIATDSEATFLERELVSVAERLRRQTTPERDTAPAVRTLVQHTHTRCAGYRIRATLVRGEQFGREWIIAVILERNSPALPTPKLIRDLFGLSQKEAQVALLLAEGKSNEEVARGLGISPHTARHHTERVLLRLGIRSRAQVPSKLLSGAREA